MTVKPPIILYEPPKRARTDYRIGLSAWTDRSMLEEGHRRGAVVEVNSTFYAIPDVATTTQWVVRTPPRFLFDVKAYGLLTGHHVDVARLPEELRRLLPATARRRDHGRVANAEFGAEARAWAFAALRASLRPLREADKLGYVLFQLAPWIKRSDEALAALRGLPRERPDTVVAVEFRHRS